MEVTSPAHSSSPRSTRSVASIHRDSLSPDLVDNRIQLILLSAFDTNPDGLQKLLDDPSCHRSSIVRSEKLSVYVYIDKALVEQCQWKPSDLDSMIVDITLHECPAPPATGRYYPTTDPGSNEPASNTARSRHISFPDGSICYIVEITVGEGVYDEIRAHIQLSPRTIVDDIMRLDIDDLGVFKSATPECNFLKSLSRHEENGNGMIGQRLSSLLKVEMVEPFQIEWNRKPLDSADLWTISIRNQLRVEVIVIHRVRLLFSHLEENVMCLNRDRFPVNIQPDDVYCFVFSATDSRKSIPIASLTWQSAMLSSPIMYQVQLDVKDHEEPPLSMDLACASEVLNHSTFSIAVTISNNGPLIHDLELEYELADPDNEPVLKPFLSLSKCIDIGTLAAGQSASARLHFLALREGLVNLSTIAVRSRSSGQRFIQDRPLVILITREPNTK